MLMLLRVRDSKKEQLSIKLKYDLKLLVTDFEEKKRWIYFLSLLFSFRREDLEYHNIPELHEGEHNKTQKKLKKTRCS